jgi:hypothetical protein
LFGVAAVDLGVLGEVGFDLFGVFLSEAESGQSAFAAILGAGDGEETAGTADEGGVEILALVQILALPGEMNLGQQGSGIGGGLGHAQRLGSRLRDEPRACPISQRMRQDAGGEVQQP